MSVGYDTEMRAGIASVLTSTLGAAIAATSWDTGWSLFQFFPCALILIGVPAVLGIYAVMIPIDTGLSQQANLIRVVAVLLSNIALVSIIYGFISVLGSGRLAPPTPGYVGFAIAAAAIWVGSNRAFRKVTANG